MGNLNPLLVERRLYIYQRNIFGMQGIILCHVDPEVDVQFQCVIRQTVEHDYWFGLANVSRNSGSHVSSVPRMRLARTSGAPWPMAR